MSEDNQAETTLCCASCGIAEVDDIKLKECADCKSVKYCSDECQKNHESYHEEACKKRAAELRDELLFKQPESSHLGDCPICMLPLPLDLSKSTLMPCCNKEICDGCHYANMLREREQRLGHACLFCRRKASGTMDGVDKQMMKRIEANDPAAMNQKGVHQYNKGDYSSAFEYFTRAAGLGDVDAHYKLSCTYRDGHGVEKDKGKESYHLEEAAIGGHPTARYNLGCDEYWDNGNIERAVKHFIIAANLGDDDSIKALMNVYKGGFVSKENFAAALRAQKAAVDETKSPQREAAEKFFG